MNHRVYAARRVVLVLGRLGFLSLIAITVFSILTGCASVPAQPATVLPAETAVPAATIAAAASTAVPDTATPVAAPPTATPNPTATPTQAAGANPKPTPRPLATKAPAAPAPTKALPAPTRAAPAAGTSVTVYNTFDQSCRIVFWGPADVTIDAGHGQSVTRAITPGAYGWRAFIGSGQTGEAGNLNIFNGATCNFVCEKDRLAIRLGCR